jgi:hypothetical protein
MVPLRLVMQSNAKEMASNPNRESMMLFMHKRKKKSIGNSKVSSDIWDNSVGSTNSSSNIKNESREKEPVRRINFISCNIMPKIKGANARCDTNRVLPSIFHHKARYRLTAGGCPVAISSGTSNELKLLSKYQFAGTDNCMTLSQKNPNRDLLNTNMTVAEVTERRIQKYLFLTIGGKNREREIAGLTKTDIQMGKSLVN